MSTFRLPVIVALFSLAFFSCKKDLSSSQGSRLKMIRVKENDSIFYRSFQYDAENRVIAIIDSNNNGDKQNFMISYDAQGKLSKVTEGQTTYTFDVDDKGRIIRKWATYAGQQTPKVEHAYSYDGNGKLAADSFYSYWSSDVYSTISYSYDQNNNVIETKTVDKSAGTTTSQEQCTYDNNTNPLYDKTVITYLLDYGYDIPAGKNNLVRETFQDRTIVDYAYEYYGNGLPKKCSFHDNNDPLVTYVDYFYE